ncbi:MAG: GntR family transcriptional regulator [Synergistales bacterium]|nr:GntR family transcriptional regulator [Synergistales bacterium]
MTQEKGSREEATYERIRNAILLHRIRPGERLSEPLIAKQLQVSRTPVRAALRRLASEGLVEIRPNSGAEVVAPSTTTVREVSCMRMLLEPEAAALAAAQQEREATADALRSAVECEEEAFRKRHIDGYIRANHHFHHCLAEASGNRLLQQDIERYLNMSDILLYLLDPFYEVADEEMASPEEHRAIIGALQKGDAATVRDRMRHHIAHSSWYLETDDDDAVESLQRRLSTDPFAEL